MLISFFNPSDLIGCGGDINKSDSFRFAEGVCGGYVEGVCGGGMWRGYVEGLHGGVCRGVCRGGMQRGYTEGYMRGVCRGFRSVGNAEGVPIIYGWRGYA